MLRLHFSHSRQATWTISIATSTRTRTDRTQTPIRHINSAIMTLLSLSTESTSEKRSYASVLLQRSLKQQIIQEDISPAQEKQQTNFCYAVNCQEEIDSCSYCSTPTHESSTPVFSTLEEEEKCEAEEEEEYISQDYDGQYLYIPVEEDLFQYDEEEEEEEEEEQKSIENEDEETDATDFQFRIHCTPKYHRSAARRSTSSRSSLPHIATRRELILACVKSTPHIPQVTTWSAARDRNIRLSIYQHSYLKDVEDKPKERKTSTSVKTKVASNKQPKLIFSNEHFRALTYRQRNLPVHVLTCNNKRWMKVLQHRLIKKQIVRERSSQKQTRMMKHANARKRKAALYAIKSNEIAECKVRSSLPEFALNWIQAWKNEERKKKEKAQQLLALPAPVKVADTATTIMKKPVPERLTPRETLLNRFLTFRRSFYLRHQKQMENALSTYYNYYVAHITAVEPSEQVRLAFMNMMDRVANPSDTLLAYHGTAPENHDSILEYGFRIPGRDYTTGPTNLSVVNGSSYGFGIYCASDAAYSVSYGHSQTVIACAVLNQPLRGRRPGNNGQVKATRGVMVLKSESRIVPLYFIRVALGQRPVHAVAWMNNEKYENQHLLDNDTNQNDLSGRSNLSPELLNVRSKMREILREFYSRKMRAARSMKLC